MLKRTVALLAALVAVVLVGCGGSDQLSKDEYLKELNAAGKALNTSFTSLGEGIGSTKDTAALGAKFTDAGKVLRDASKQIGDIKPPEDAKAANDKLAEGLSKMADSFEEVGKETKGAGNDAAGLLPKINALTTSDGIKLVTEAINDLKAKGYNVSNN
jgi:hypothetical protein